MRLACLCLLFLLATRVGAEERLLVCVEDADFPPFTYFDHTGGKAMVRGSTPAMLERLSRQAGVAVEIVPASVKRCLLGVERGSFDIGVDVYHDAERAAKYDFSPPYATLHPYYYYDRSRYPEGLNVKSRADLKRYRGCGLFGYSYEHFGLAPGPNFDINSYSHAHVARMLLAGRCDYFPAVREVVDGFRLLGKSDLGDNPAIGSAAVYDARAPQLHLIYSRQSVRVQKLRPAIDAFIAGEKGAAKAAR